MHLYTDIKDTNTLKLDCSGKNINCTCISLVRSLVTLTFKLKIYQYTIPKLS